MAHKGLAEHGAGIAHVYHTARRSRAELHAYLSSRGGAAPAAISRFSAQRSLRIGLCSTNNTAQPPQQSPASAHSNALSGRHPCSWRVRHRLWRLAITRRMALRGSGGRQRSEGPPNRSNLLLQRNACLLPLVRRRPGELFSQPALHQIEAVGMQTMPDWVFVVMVVRRVLRQ